MIMKVGEVRVPCGPSPPPDWNCPGAEDMLGRCSAPPIHQSPWWLDGPLLRAVGLSPYVGWLSNTVPVFFHSSIPFSKSNLQGTQDKENRAERFVFISNNALKNKNMDISMASIFHNWQIIECYKIFRSRHYKQNVAKQNENVKEKQCKIDEKRRKGKQIDVIKT